MTARRGEEKDTDDLGLGKVEVTPGMPEGIQSDPIAHSSGGAFLSLVAVIKENLNQEGPSCARRSPWDG